MTPKLLTEEQVAKILDVSIETLQTWRYRPPIRPLPWTKVGGKVRYREDKLNKWIDEHTYDDPEMAALDRKPA